VGHLGLSANVREQRRREHGASSGLSAVGIFRRRQIAGVSSHRKAFEITKTALNVETS
jgi:hypothetical protein